MPLLTRILDFAHRQVNARPTSLVCARPRCGPQAVPKRLQSVDRDIFGQALRFGCPMAVLTHEVGFQLLGCFFQIAFRDDLVALKDSPRTMP